MSRWFGPRLRLSLLILALVGGYLAYKIYRQTHTPIPVLVIDERP